MKPSEYILNELNELSSFKPTTVDDADLIDTIYKFLMSKKFRKYATNPEYIPHIRSAISIAIEKNEPIKLTLVFGGYKLWRLEESPSVDWAELFSLMYYTKWLIPICNVYKPGVWFDFFSDDVILEIMDNIPRKDTHEYLESFKHLLAFIKGYIPENLKYTLNRVEDQYTNYDEFKKELDKSIDEMQKNELPQLTPEQESLVELNVRTNPNQKNDPHWKQNVFLIHESYAKSSKRRPYYRNPEKIFVITKQMKDSIAIGTTKTSVVKFWVGVGVLKKKEDRYIEYILSPRQLEAAKFDIADIRIDGLDSKNFNTIRILNIN